MKRNTSTHTANSVFLRQIRSDLLLGPFYVEAASSCVTSAALIPAAPLPARCACASWIARHAHRAPDSVTPRMAALAGGLAASVCAAAPRAPASPRRRARTPHSVPDRASRAAAALCSRHGASLLSRLAPLCSAEAAQPYDAASPDPDAAGEATDGNEHDGGADAPPGALRAGGDAQLTLGPYASCAVCCAEEAALAACVAAAQHAAADAAEEAASCPICFESLFAPEATPCAHVFCGHCIRRYLQLRADARPCPLCRAPVRAAELAADAALAARVEAQIGAHAHAARAEAVRAEQQAWAEEPVASLHDGWAFELPWDLRAMTMVVPADGEVFDDAVTIFPGSDSPPMTGLTLHAEHLASSFSRAAFRALREQDSGRDLADLMRHRLAELMRMRHRGASVLITLASDAERLSELVLDAEEQPPALSQAEMQAAVTAAIERVTVTAADAAAPQARRLREAAGRRQRRAPEWSDAAAAGRRRRR